MIVWKQTFVEEESILSLLKGQLNEFRNNTNRWVVQTNKCALTRQLGESKECVFLYYYNLTPFSEF